MDISTTKELTPSPEKPESNVARFRRYAKLLSLYSRVDEQLAGWLWHIAANPTLYHQTLREIR